MNSTANARAASAGSPLCAYPFELDTNSEQHARVSTPDHARTRAQAHTPCTASPLATDVSPLLRKAVAHTPLASTPLATDVSPWRKGIVADVPPLLRKGEAANVPPLLTPFSARKISAALGEPGERRCADGMHGWTVVGDVSGNRVAVQVF